MVLSTRSETKTHSSHRHLAARAGIASLITLGAILAPLPSRGVTSSVEASGAPRPGGPDGKAESTAFGRGPGVGLRGQPGGKPPVIDLRDPVASEPLGQQPDSTGSTPPIAEASAGATAGTASASEATATSTSATSTEGAGITSTSTAGTSTTTTSASTTSASTTTRPTTSTASTSTTTTTTRPTTTTTGSSSTSSTTSTTRGGPTLVWEDHFNSLDTSRWKLEHSTYGDGNNELQCYQPENVTVTGGRLVLTARSESVTCPRDRQRSVSSGMVRSRGLTFSPGQAIEFRVKLTPNDPDDQGGLWPAVWASSWAGSWPSGGELDWLEVMTAEDPSRAMFSMHYADRSGRHELQNKAVPTGSYFSDSWHTIRFDYGHGGRLRWYLDGRQVFAVDHADTSQGYPAPFDRTIDEIKINLAIGGTPGPLAPGALGRSGATFEVDYIRVFDL